MPFNKQKYEFKKNSSVLIIILVAIFSMAGGMVGFLFFRGYFLEDIFNIAPFSGEINLSRGGFGEPSLVIRNPKKVVVEQNKMVVEIISSAKNSLVGIFEKKRITKKNKKAVNQFSLADYYDISRPLAQGLIITSDGWIITEFNPSNLKNYVIITADEKIYSINKTLKDNSTKFYFLHIEASDLPVKKFSSLGEIRNGQLAVAVNWREGGFLTSVANSYRRSDSLVNSSDFILRQINLTDNLGREFSPSVLFDLSGSVVGLVDKTGQVFSISNFTSAINSILKFGEIKRAWLGVNYIDLSQLIYAGTDGLPSVAFSKGALLYKDKSGVAVERNSEAFKSGLRERDIITLVNNIEVNEDNNLSDILQSFLAGERVNIIFWRNGQEKETAVELGELIEK